ncbi:uncharacterized protein LOC110933568 [Helianthus annuus]|uniref:uncharacterized protein LOC110933568 n=1 Tax=Helianthus annuus TaxID=4232 RepID=UPI000B8EF33D|nr:uncharacterized protein LOC110933568 [Helianthus annuus]
MQTTVFDLVDDQNMWRWSSAWFDLYPVVINLPPSTLDQNRGENLVWKDSQSNNTHFSSGWVWNNIRRCDQEVPWVDLVWFAQCIPRHSFHLWLVIKNKLKTQDRMGIWDMGSATNLNLMCCPLCRYNKDSRDHLIFECPFAMQVWNKVKDIAYMDSVDASWASIMAWFEQRASSKSSKTIVSKLVVAAAAYFVWQERNNRLFSQNHQPSSKIADIVLQTVRFKLMTFRARRRSKNPFQLERWKMQMKTMDIDTG